jgi:hypothetical protein
MDDGICHFFDGCPINFSIGGGNDTGYATHIADFSILKGQLSIKSTFSDHNLKVL